VLCRHLKKNITQLILHTERDAKRLSNLPDFFFRVYVHITCHILLSLTVCWNLRKRLNLQNSDSCMWWCLRCGWEGNCMVTYVKEVNLLVSILPNRYGSLYIMVCDILDLTFLIIAM